MKALNPLSESAGGKPQSQRFSRIKHELLRSDTHLCPERALLVTDYFKKIDNPHEPMIIRRAKALRHILSNKSVRIFDDELIAGNVGSCRKSVIMHPELAGVMMAQDLLWIGRRKTTPHKISWPDRLRLIFNVIPYWLNRNMAARAFKSHPLSFLRFVTEQMNATYYLINESGGIGHFLPDYGKMIRTGINGYLRELEGKDDDFADAARIACSGLTSYAKRLSVEAYRVSELEADSNRKNELREISRICAKVPMEPAETLHEALQSLWLTHMTVCLESLNSAVSFGRIDQYLYPFYEKDIQSGRLSKDDALDLLLCFSAKTTEHMFLLSGRTSEYHGGYLVAQAATVGGTDVKGGDAVNDLTWLFLDVMEISGLRDPNYMARIHEKSDPAYVSRAVEVACAGKAVPGLFNDAAVINALTLHGYPIEEALDYGIVGCVEPTIPGRSFCSTDAGLFNLPMCLLLALNKGRKPGSLIRIGAPTPDLDDIRDMESLISAFNAQLDFMVERMVRDFHIIEKGNRDFHPTPFSSMLVKGCIENSKDITAGGAMFNSSGIQGVGVADTADCLAAIDELVFTRKQYSLKDILMAINKNFIGFSEMRARLTSASKFGNDKELPDGYANMVVRLFHDSLGRFCSTRGGAYIPGFYSSTCHVGFGNRTPALPSGRLSGQPFAASLSCSNGSDRLGPTALLNSVAKIDSSLSPNGYALNIRFDASSLKDSRAKDTITALAKGFFSSGGMEMQLNVLDASMLSDARANPGKYPGLVVRVAGYCAYFDDLPESVKDEIINRTRVALA